MKTLDELPANAKRAADVNPLVLKGTEMIDRLAYPDDHPPSTVIASALPDEPHSEEACDWGAGIGDSLKALSMTASATLASVSLTPASCDNLKTRKDIVCPPLSGAASRIRRPDYAMDGCTGCRRPPRRS